MRAEPQRKPAASFDTGSTLPHSPIVLLLVDVINPLDFPGAENITAPALEAARATAKLKHDLRKAGAMVIYANDNYGMWRSDFRDLLARCKRRPGGAGKIARLLAPKKDDLVLLKPRHSAFFATPLEILLSQMHTRRIVLAGLAADICVQLTAMDAHQRGYKLRVPANCTAAESPEAKQAALGYMKRTLKADIRDV